MSKFEKFLIILFLVCVMSAFAMVFWKGFSDEILQNGKLTSKSEKISEPEIGSLDSFTVDGKNFIVNGKFLKRVEIWSIPSGTDVLATDYVKLGDAQREVLSGLNAWVLPIPNEVQAVVEIFAKVFDENGKEIGRLSLSYDGMDEIIEAVWGSQKTNQNEISLQDNGKYFSYTLGSEFVIALEGSKYLEQELLCQPDGIVIEIASSTELAVPSISKSFVGKATGTCQFVNNDFSLGIKIFDTKTPLEYYEKKKYDLSFSYPSENVVSDNGENQFFTKNILNRIDLPANIFYGTNLSEVSFIVGVTVNDKIKDACLKADVSEEQQPTKNINGTDFAVFKSSEASAGNRYETISFRTIKNGRCYEAVEMLHWGDINNYPAGTVKEFDQVLIQSKLDNILETLQIK